MTRKNFFPIFFTSFGLWFPTYVDTLLACSKECPAGKGGDISKQRALLFENLASDSSSISKADSDGLFTES